MNTKQQVWASIVAVGLGLGASYALAEKSPSADKKPAAANGPSCEGDHDGKPGCDHHKGMHGDHECMHGDHESMQGDHECMQGDHECMHGDHECMHGGKDGAMGCPMMGMDRPALDAKVENTAGGAVIRLTAKNPADAAKVQKMATMIAAHLGPGPGAPPPATVAPAATMKATPKH